MQRRVRGGGGCGGGGRLTIESRFFRGESLGEVREKVDEFARQAAEPRELSLLALLGQKAQILAASVCERRERASPRVRAARCLRLHTSAYVCIRQHTSASAYVSIRQHTRVSKSTSSRGRQQQRQYVKFCTSKA